MLRRWITPWQVALASASLAQSGRSERTNVWVANLPLPPLDNSFVVVGAQQHSVKFPSSAVTATATATRVGKASTVSVEARGAVAEAPVLTLGDVGKGVEGAWRAQVVTSEGVACEGSMHPRLLAHEYFESTLAASKTTGSLNTLLSRDDPPPTPNPAPAATTTAAPVGTNSSTARQPAGSTVGVLQGFFNAVSVQRRR